MVEVLDTVANGYVEKATDDLAKAKNAFKTRMNSKGTQREKEESEGVETVLISFDKFFGYSTPAVIDQETADRGIRVIAHVMNKLSAVNLEIPPRLFLEKYCYPHVRQLYDGGDIPETPRLINYFCDTPKGKGVIDHGIEAALSDKSRESNLQKTNAYLDTLRNRPDPTDEEKTALSTMLANAFTPEAQAAAKEARRIKCR